MNILNRLKLERHPYVSFNCENKKRTIALNVFSKNRTSPKPKYCAFKFEIYLFDENYSKHWIELILFNWIASLRVDSIYGRKRLEIWKKKRGLT